MKKPMSNVQISTKGNKLHITIDLKAFKDVEKLPLSSTGKSYLVATSNGFHKLEGKHLDGLSLSLNLSTSKKSYDEKIALKQARETAKEVQAEIAATSEFSPEEIAQAIEILRAMRQ